MSQRRSACRPAGHTRRWMAAPSAALLFWSVLATAPAAAQGAATSEIRGRVTDPSSSAVAAATVFVTEKATGVERQVVSDPDGRFAVPLLSPGEYDVRVERDGFGTGRVTGLRLQVGEQVSVDVMLRVGNVQESVTVAAETPVQIQNTDRSLVVNERRVRELPLNGKNFQRLVLLVPGVGVATANPVFSGARGSTNTYNIDGIGASDQREQRGLSLGGGAALLANATPNLISTEAIQEFRVTSSNADATFGRGSGGQVSLVTKSGTNELHGSSYYYHRNDALDARDFFNSGPFLDDRGRAIVPPFKQHQYGATLGGALRQNRDFFFGSFEGFRQRLTQTDATTVIPNAALIGLMPGDLGRFYRTFYIDRGVIPGAGNPAGEFRPAYTTEAERQQFLNAGFRAALFDGNAANEEAGTVRLTSARTRDIDQDAVLVRTDHRLGDRLFASVRYAYARPEQLTNLIAYPNNNAITKLGWHHALLQGTYVVSPRQSLEIRAGVLRSEYAEGSEAGVDSPLRDIGVSEFGVSVNASGTGLNQLVVSPQRNFVDNQTVPELSVVHTWNRGRLQWRSGAQVRRSMLNTLSAGSATPVYNFSGFLGSAGILGVGPSQAQAIVSSASVTQFGTGGGVTTPLRGWRQTEQEYFVQGELQARQNLSISLGLRYSYFSPLSERHDVLSNLYAVDANGNLDPAVSPFTYGRLSTRVARAGDDVPFYQPDRNNFQPRLGAAWDVFGTGRSVVKASYGLYADRIYQLMVLSAPNSTPFSISGSATSTAASPVEFRLGTLPPINPNAPGIFGIDPAIRNPYTHRYHATLEQRVSANTSVAVSYVGAAGRGLVWNANVNGGSAGVPQDRRPDPRFALQTMAMGTGSSDYHALQLLAHRRNASGLDFTVAYTYASARDNVSDEAFGSPPALLNLGASSATGFQGGAADQWVERPIDLNRGYADFHLRHNLTISHVWDLPFGRGRRFLSGASPLVQALAGGYSLAGLAIIRSGQPFSVTMFGDFGDVGSFTYRPRLISGALDDFHAGGADKTQFLIPAADAQARVALPSDINDIGAGIPRNALTGPSVWTYDVSLVKRIALTGRTSMAVEVNAFNVFNHANFAAPSGNVGSAFFGQLTSTAPGTTPRQIQIGARFAF